MSADVSTLPLSDLARHVVYPTGIVDSVWYDLDDRFREWGISFDRWQDDAGTLLLGTRKDGKYATTVGGSTFSIPRQVAKTFLVSRTVFALCTVFEEQTWLWTAHRGRTSTQTFQKLAGFTQRKAVKKYLAPDRSDGLRTTNGEQEIRFENGSRLLFGARENGFGRGFDEVDGEVFDEAQILTEFALDDMIPAANQSRNPHGALLVFMGTPPSRATPKEIEKGEVFTSRRRKALKDKPTEVKLERGDALYIEFSADDNVGEPGGPSLDDDAQIRKANPSYPHRTPPESIARMRENLASDDAWKREALGVWETHEEGTGVIDQAAWAGHAGSLIEPTGPVVLAVETTLDRSLSVLVAVGAGDDDVPQVRTVDSQARTGWVPGRVVQVIKDHPEVVAVVMDARDSADPVADAIEEALEAADLDVEIVRMSYPDTAEACADTFDLIHDGQLRHRGDDARLNTAVRGAVKQENEGGFVWSRKKGGAESAPLVAMTRGLWEWRRRVASTYDVMDSIG